MRGLKWPDSPGCDMGRPKPPINLSMQPSLGHRHMAMIFQLDGHHSSRHFLSGWAAMPVAEW